MSNDLSSGIVIPAYNPDVQTLLQYIENIKNTIKPGRIHVEIDSPSEESISELDNVVDSIHISEDRRGKGSAIMSGFDLLNTDILAFADADGSVPASSLYDIISQVSDGNEDVCISSRRHPSSRIMSHQTIMRRFLGDVFAYTARKMLPTQCRDYQCGAKAVRAEAWESIGHHCYEPGFAWDMEFVSVAGSLGYKIAEVPVDWKDHPNSTVNPISTSIELATALINIKRRTDAIASSPRFRNVDQTVQSNLLDLDENDD
ncbi:glycosyltransferase [Salinigranum salinum]|uniref:glycosyltransferase n=1 Tax=Salinigranum salinum TaxID=1364937 RepID=UPI00126045F7|nr:glycosyltransferase [Salinigranum salinum]